MKEPYLQENTEELITLLLDRIPVFYQKNGKNFFFFFFFADLPYNAWGVYYTDEIGNISTSNAWRDVNSFIFCF